MVGRSAIIEPWRSLWCALRWPESLMRFDTAATGISFVVGVALLVGCGRPAANGPATVPVRGKIVFTRGGDVKTLFNKQARIEFESVEQPGVRAAGPIEEDGSFVVATVTAEG